MLDLIVVTGIGSGDGRLTPAAFRFCGGQRLSCVGEFFAMKSVSRQDFGESIVPRLRGKWDTWFELRTTRPHGLFSLGTRASRPQWNWENTKSGQHLRCQGGFPVIEVLFPGSAGVPPAIGKRRTGNRPHHPRESEKRAGRPRSQGKVRKGQSATPSTGKRKAGGTPALPGKSEEWARCSRSQEMRCLA